MTRTGRLALAVVIALTGGCGAADATSSRDTAWVLAASSLASTFGDLQRSSGAPAQTSFAGSQALVAQVEQGAPADVIATADMATMDRLARAGRLASAPRVFATNRLTIVVGKGNPRRIGALRDLARPGLVVVLAAPQVPAGRYAGEALVRAGVRVRPSSLEESVGGVVTKVALGEADAGLAYATDIRSSLGVAGVEIPATDNVVVRYPVALLAGARHPEAGRRFIRLLFSSTGQRVLREHGFLSPA